MTVEVFLTILVVCSAISSLITEAVKSTIKDIKIPYNFLVLCISLAVGVISTGIYYTVYGIEPTLLNICYMLFMGIANWVGAMVGYDKVKQAISQIGTIK